METHVEKINAILDAISQDIAEREKVADNAMHVLEKMKPVKFNREVRQEI